VMREGKAGQGRQRCCFEVAGRRSEVCRFNWFF
jgi:hypothetical protein